MSGYGNTGVWKDVQTFLPERLHFTSDHHPEEDWWETQGHKIHLDRWRNPNAKIRLILFHGVGTNGRQMSMILGRPLHEAGFELTAIDMPGYGCTITNPSALIGYDDWVKIGSDFVDHELENDSRPIALYGLSAGGMETYHVAALNKKVKGIIGMTFIEMRDWAIRDQVSLNLFISRVGIPGAAFSNLFPFLRSMTMPMWLASKMHTLVNNNELLRIMMKDPASAGRWNSMHFIATHGSYKPALEPEEFDVCPMLLTQPVEDKWTPQWITDAFFAKVKKVETKIVQLEGAGHYPIEEPGLKQMGDAIIEFLRKLS
jgi:alpha-beta hydrolase superfamily lysophospholipase